MMLMVPVSTMLHQFQICEHEYALTFIQFSGASRHCFSQSIKVLLKDCLIKMLADAEKLASVVEFYEKNRRVA